MTLYRQANAKNGYYNETFENYDLLGNVGRITRKKNNVLIDDIRMSYQGANRFRS